MVSCVARATKITKGNRTLGKSEGFSKQVKTKQLFLHGVGNWLYSFFILIVDM